MNEYTNRTKQL